MNVRTMAVAAIAVIGLSGAANAALVNGDVACLAGGVSLSPGTYEECAGSFEGNDSQLGFEDYINGLFGTTGTWSEWAKAEEDNSWEDGGLKILSGLGGTSGTFSLTGLTGTAVIVLKASTCFSAYLFSGIGSPASGEFDTGLAGLRTGVRGDSCNEEGNVPGISHMTVYTNGEVPPPVPLPAAGWLLLAGVGGLAAMRRKKAA